MNKVKGITKHEQDAMLFDWQEDAEMWGKQISGEIQVWAHALELGFRWKKQQEAKNDTL